MNFFQISATETRLLTFADNSNFARLIAFNDALSFVLSKWEFYISGTNHYMELNSNAVNIPHHWFMLLWIENGFLFAITIFALLIRIIFIIPVKLLPVMGALFTMGSVIGYFPFASPLIVVVLISLIF
jgi:hypothetical protein